ncbi:MAG: reprolysin-like metallopeptidase [Bacteroidota bacterium]
MRLLLLLLFLTPMISIGQQQKLWTAASGDTAINQSNRTVSNVYTLNREQLRSLVNEANLTGKSTIAIPHPDGGASTFQIHPTSLMARPLQLKYPEIKTFKGYNQNGEKIYLDVNPTSLHATIFSKEGTYFVDPADEAENKYRSYFKGNEHAPHAGHDVSCQEVVPQSVLNKLNAAQKSDKTVKRSNGLQLRKYRIAVVAHETFTTRTGVANALATIVTILNRTNAVFENELAITLELVANNDQLIMTRSNPGPFNSNGVADLLLRENGDFLDEVIGNENYDIGHVIGGAAAGGGGIASVRSVCVADRKANGATSILFRTDNLNTLIEIFIHEIGHQFGAFHTFTSGNSCSFGVSNFHQRAAYEMGSGITMMSYAGICGANNSASVRENYFHSVSIDNILDYIEREANCAETISTNNIPPQLSLREGGFTIPINTPFVLEVEANDANGDELSYTWEQFDQATKMEDRPGTPYSDATDISYFSIEEFMASDEFYTRQELEDLILPDGSKLDERVIEIVLSNQETYIASFFEGDGPLFRGFPPSDSPKRYFPRLSKILAGETAIEQSVFEVLPFKTRDLNFKINVRDNNPAGGALANELLSFSSSADAGPFVVTSILDESTYSGNATLALRWDVANTNVAPVNCQEVDIRYSTDGGQNFDIVLAQNTANDGFEHIILPNINTEEGRIMVKASDNVFFNVNDRNITVEAISSAIPISPSSLTAEVANDVAIELSWNDNSDSEAGFIIERKIDNGSFVVLDSVTANSQRFRDETYVSTSNYAYRVAAYNEDGNSPYSNEARVSAALSTETDIITFSIGQQNGASSINTANHTVDLELAFGSDLTALTPQITVSPGASVSPNSGQLIDFTNPVNYRVTAEDGTTFQDWVVTVTLEADTRKTDTDFITFLLAEQTTSAEINTTEHTVQIEVARGTSLGSLTPSFTLSEGATSSPESGQTIDFTNPVVYTITAENSEISQEWEVTVTEEEDTRNTETDLLTFQLPEQTKEATINTAEHSVQVEVVRGTNLGSLTPSFTISEGATSAPDSGETLDFTNPVVYTITAENSDISQAWEVTVTEEEDTRNTETNILTFQLPEQTDIALIDASEHTVQVQVVAGTEVNALTPVISLSEGADSSPASGEEVDFTNSVSYLVTAENDNFMQNWTVTVSNELVTGIPGLQGLNIFPNPANNLLNIETSTLSTIKLTDLKGRLLFSTETDTKTVIELSDLRSGTYLLMVEQGNHTLVRRIIKLDE